MQTALHAGVYGKYTFLGGGLSTERWCCLMKFLQQSKLKLKTNLYSAIKSEGSQALESGTSQLGSQRGF